MTMPAMFDPSRCVVFDLECYPGRWCVGFHGIDHAGRLSTKIVETKNDLEGLLRHFAKQGRTLVSYNGERFDVPLIRAILKGIDPYAPAQQIIRENRLPPALANAMLPEFPCDHIDLSARLRRGGSFPSLKVVAANLGGPILRELPFEPGAVFTDSQWDEVKTVQRHGPGPHLGLAPEARSRIAGAGRALAGAGPRLAIRLDAPSRRAGIPESLSGLA